MRAVTAAALITAVVLDAIAQPNLRSWSCISKEFENDVRNNTIGFESVCFDLVRIDLCFTYEYIGNILLTAVRLLGLLLQLVSQHSNS